MSRRAKLPVESEKALRQRVLQLLHTLGYRTYYARYSLGADPGWPDIFAVRGKTAFALELKREGKEPTVEQSEWIAALGGVEHLHALVVKPSTEVALQAALQGAER